MGAFARCSWWTRGGWSWARGSSRTSIDVSTAARAKRRARRASNTASWSKLARAQIEQHYQRPLASRVARDFVYRRLLPHPRRIAAAARVLRVYQRTGLAALARGTGILKLLGLQDRERLLPKIDTEFFFGDLGKTFPARGPRRARVAFFAGCVAQVTFSELNRATIRVLQANGCEVVVPAGQICCGALAAHAGVRDVARDLARANFEAFPANDFDAIITNAAGCGSTLKEYTHLFPAVDPAHEQAAQFTIKIRDISEFLADLGLTAPLREVPLRVTYQDSCHLAHGQKIREAPRKLIRAVPGVELIEMQLADQCCGSAGVYNVTETEASLELLALKMDSARGTKAQAIVTANPGCILQLRAGAAIHGTGQEVLHVVELLDRALSQRELTTFLRRDSGSPSAPSAPSELLRRERRSDLPRDMCATRRPS